MPYKSTQSGFTSIAIAVLAIILIGGGILFYNKNSASVPKKDAGTPVVSAPVENTASPEGTETAVKAGIFEPYAPEKIAKAETGKVVLFFKADWCPTCRALDADIKAHLKDIPENLAILTLDYDTSDALKKKYKVTTQHTLVQVDAKGEQIKQWKGSMTLADFLAQVQ